MIPVRVTHWGLCWFLATLSGCEEEPSAKAAVPRPVKTYEVPAAGAGVSREWPGHVEPTQNAELSFYVPGKLTELNVTEGQAVEKGTVLARLDPRDYRARLNAAQAELKQVTQEQERTRSLVDQQVAPRSELDLAERTVGVAQASVDQARKALQDSELRAPFSGVVAKKMVDNFQSVLAKQTIVVLQDATSLEIVTHVPERDLAAAAPGLTIEERNKRITPKASFSAIEGQTFDCDLKEIASVADPITRTYEVTWSINPPEGVNILPGMAATVTLENLKVAETSTGVSVPANAVVGADDGTFYVWTIDHESMKVSKTPVTVGEMQGRFMKILSGVGAKDLVAISGMHELQPGMQVTRFEDIYGAIERAQ